MKKYKYYRITVLMSEEVHKKVLELAIKEKRPKSGMAALLIEDGLKLVNKEVFIALTEDEKHRIKTEIEHKLKR